MQTRRRGFASRRAAQSALTKTLRELGDQTYVAPQRQSLGDYLQVTWLPAIRSTVRPSTYDSYARNIGIHVAPKPIAGVPIQQIQPPMLNALYSELLAGENRRALSPRTVSYIHTILHRAFRDAVRWNLLIRNPCDLADPPRARRAELVRERTWFCTRSGEPLHPKIASDLFRKAVIQHDMPSLSVHGLRHTWATLALQAGVHPKIVQERLGHSTIAITLDIYSHVNPAVDAEAANTVAALIREQS